MMGIYFWSWICDESLFCVICDGSLFCVMCDGSLFCVMCDGHFLFCVMCDEEKLFCVMCDQTPPLRPSKLYLSKSGTQKELLQALTYC
jgi:hypothetical protein